MQPEDIDKLFRDQLQHHAPAPPAYLWEQLEAEIQPAKKRPALWLYAAAAMIALLIVAGGGWLLRTALSDTTVNGQLAATPGAVAPQSLAAASPATTHATEKSAATQATTANGLASSPSEEQPATADVAATSQPAASTAPRPALPQQVASNNAPAASAVARQAVNKAVPAARRQPASVPTRQALATATTTPITPAAAQPERLAAVAAVAPAAPTPVSLALTGAIEVEVHRGTDAPIVVVAAADVPQSYESDSHLKNLFHKAKTAVKDGRVKLPKVELPETVTVQVNVFNHSATKVIQL